MENGLKDRDGQLPGKTIISPVTTNTRCCWMNCSTICIAVCRTLLPGHRQLRSPCRATIDDFKGLDESTNKELTIAISLTCSIPVLMSRRLWIWSLPTGQIKSEVLADDWPWYAPLSGLYGYDDNGKPLDKQKFRISITGAILSITSCIPKRPKSQDKIACAKTLRSVGYAGGRSTRKFDKQAVDLVAHQLREQITHWMKSRLPYRKSGSKKRSTWWKGAAPAFSENTAGSAIYSAPLMQWLDVRGQSDAMRFDRIFWRRKLPVIPTRKSWMCSAGHRRKSGAPAAAFGAGAATGQRINQLRDLGWWKQASLEGWRIFAFICVGSCTWWKKTRAKIWFDTGGYYRRCEPHPDRTRKTNIRSIDFKLYRQQVQGHWSRCSSKIRCWRKSATASSHAKRAGWASEACADPEPQRDIRALKEFYPQATASLDKLCVPSSGWTATRWKCALLSSPW